MDVKPGYKQTEIGMIPEDWDVKPLVEISTEIGDGIHTTPEYVHSSAFFFINGNNLVDGKIAILENTMCISEPEYRRLRKNLNDRTILISINGTIGNLATFNGETVVLGKSAAYINIFKNILRDYIYYHLMSAATANYIENELTGTTINNSRSNRCETLQFQSLEPKKNSMLSPPPSAMWMPSSPRWTDSSPRSATSSRLPCRSCSRGRGGCQGSAGSGW